MDWINVGKQRVRVLRTWNDEPLEAGERVVVNHSIIKDGVFEVGVLVVRTPALELVDRLAVLACMVIDAGVRRWAPKAGES